MKKLLIPGLAFVALAFSAMKTYDWRWQRDVTAPPAEPARVPESSTVAGVGLVEPSSEDIGISTPVSGLVMRVHVKTGDVVKRGSPLFSLDDRHLRSERELRRSALTVARARLERLYSAPRREEIGPAEARVREAEAALSDAAIQQRLIESVTDRRAIREEDLLRRREATRAAEARVAEARSALELIQAGAWEHDIAVARAEVANSEAAVKRVEADLDRLTMRAPVAGRVLRVNVRPGEFAQAGPLPDPLIVMGQVDALHVRVDVDENEAWRVRPGAAAEAVERGTSGRRAALEFVRVEPYVVPKRALTGDTTERVDTRVLQVLYRFADAETPFFVGQQMDVFIEAAR